MNARMTGRLWTTALLAGLLGLTGLGRAWADSDPTDDADSLTITVRPDVNYSVNLTTTDAQLQLGTVGLGQSTWTVRPATVTFGGTVLTGHELKLSAAITSAGTAWGFDATPSTAATPNAGASAEADKLAMYALFSSTMLAAAPADVTFGDPAAGTNPPVGDAAVDDGDGNNTVNLVRAGGGVDGAGSATGVKFEYHENAGINAGEKDMDDNVTGSANTGTITSGAGHVWFYLRLPSDSSTGTDQNIQVTLTHTLGDI